MRESISIKYGDEYSTEVVVGPLKESLSEKIEPLGRHIIIITDVNGHLHNRELVDSLDHIIIGQGESIKTLRTLEEVYRRLLELGADRTTFLLGIGGGIVTDITGFVASTYMRGIGFGLVPTTLLAQVDASVGGKNGVNLDGYKNIIGAFNQPLFVICDPATLATLPDREMRAGLAEVIKAGIISDPELFALLESHSFEEIRSDEELLRRVIIRAVRVKAEIVQKDELEAGERRKLNLGHTFAHAMEKVMPSYSHGEAVAAGISVVADAAVREGILGQNDSERIKALIEKMGLPTSYPIETRKLLGSIKYDKKRQEDSIHLVFPTSIGSCQTRLMKLSDLEEMFIVD